MTTETLPAVRRTRMKKAKTTADINALSESLLKVADAAVVWWAMKRPVQWSLDQHLQNCRINTITDAEKHLADAVAAWLRASK